MASNYEKMYQKDYQKLLDKYDQKSEENRQLKYEYLLILKLLLKKSILKL